MLFDVRQAIREDDQRRRNEHARSLVDHDLERDVIAALVADDAVDIAQPPTGSCPCGRCRWAEVEGGFAGYGSTSARAALAGDVEEADFAHPHYREVFAAIENAHPVPPFAMTGALPADAYEIWETVRRRDRVRDGHAAEVITLEWLLELVISTARVTVDYLRAAARRLRSLAEIRRLA